MKKRLVALVLCIVMMFSLVSVQAFADTGSDGSVSVTTTAKKVEVGKTFDVTIKVTPNGVAAGAVNFTVALSAGLEYVSHQILVSTSDYMMSNYDVATGVFGCAVTTNGKSVAFNVLKLTLKAKDTNVGENSISLTNVTISNVAGDANLNYATTVAPVTVTTSVPVVAVTSVTVSSKTLNLEVGQTRTLTATVTPDNATDKTVTWTSDKESVATVANDGTVTAVGAGTATITATAANGKKGACKVTVTPAACAHTDKTLVPKEESTCMKQGHDAYYTCDKCHAMFDMDGKVITKIPYLPLAAHKLTKIDAVPATCTEDGTEAYWTCSVCKKMFADKDGKKEIKAPVKVAALGHDIGEKTLETAGVAGSKLALYSATCKTCDKKVYTAMLEMPDNTLNVVAKQSDNSKKDFSKAVTFGVKASDSKETLKFTIDPVTDDIVKAAKTKAGYKVTETIYKDGAYGWGLADYSETPEAAYTALAEYLKNGITFTQTISAKENTWNADAKSHTMTFDINTADGTFTVKVDGKNESTITFTNTFTYKTVSPGGGGGGSTTTDTTKTDGKKVESGKTFDAGIAMYVGLSVLSVTGGALVIGKKKERF